MKTAQKIPRHLRIPRIILVLGGLGLLLGLGLGVYRVVSGKSLNLKGILFNPRANIISPIRVLFNQSQVASYSKGNFTNVIFLHHSVGNGIITQGNLRELLNAKGITLWDQGYLADGLRSPDGKPLGFTYAIPRDNTDPEGLAELFSQPLYNQPVNGFSQMMQHEVILIKSCFPVNNIENQAQQDQLKTYYQNIRRTMVQHPEKLFIILTTPPLNPAETNVQNAARAREMSKWLQSDAFLQGAVNVRVFDLYSLLAENDPQKLDDDMLQQPYREGNDSHPNAPGNQKVAEQLADFLQKSITEYSSIASLR